MPNKRVLFSSLIQFVLWFKRFFKFQTNIEMKGILQLLLLCVRYVVIVFPIRSRSLCTMSNCKKIMIIVWVVSLLLATPVILTKVRIRHYFFWILFAYFIFNCSAVLCTIALALKPNK